MKKLFTILALILLLALPASALCDSTANVFLYKDVPHIWHVSPHYIGETLGIFLPGHDACMFRLTTHDANGKVTGQYPTYCADFDTRAVVDSRYERLNLEDAGYFTAEQAAHVRSILHEGYWPNGESTLQLAKNAGVTHPEKLTNAEALTATQAAIWYYTNGAQSIPSPYSATSNFWIPLYYSHIYDDKTVAPRESSISDDAFYVVLPDVADRIQTVFDYLIGLEGTKAGEVIWSFSGEHIILSRVWQKDDAVGANTRPSFPENSGSFWEDLFDYIFGSGWKEPDGDDEGKFYYQILTRFKLKGTPEGLRSLKLTAQLRASDAADAQILDTKVYDLTSDSDVRRLSPDKDGYYTVDFSYPLDSSEFTAEPAVILHLVGEQDVENDVYLYMPASEDGGRENSQTMVGFAAGRTPIDVASLVEVSGASITVRGQKYLDESLCRMPYTFELIDVTDPQNPRHCGYTQNNRFGDFTFPSVHYSKAGTYRYQVKEQIPEGMFGADETVYTLEVLVEEDEGHLVARDYVITSPKQADSIVFNNCGTTDVSVRKVWDVPEGDAIPASVEITLLKNGKAYDSVILSDANEWSHTWTNLACGNAVWSVEETAELNAYQCSIKLHDTTFIVTNSAGMDIPQLPQTGDHEHPLFFLLSALSACLCMLALRRRSA